MKRFRGFTLIELMVVVAIIAVLVAILLPSLSKAREMTTRSVCGANLKGQGSAFAIYAAQNNDRIVSSPGNWLHDLSYDATNLLVGTQITAGANITAIQKWFYCPSNNDVVNTSNWTGSGSFHYFTYAYFVNRSGSYGIQPVGTSGSNRKSGKSPPIALHKKFTSEPFAANSELVTDETISRDTSGTGFGEANPDSLFHERSNHVSSRFPPGQNVLSCDGHVSWRSWGSLNSATALSQSANAYFWVIDP